MKPGLKPAENVHYSLTIFSVTSMSSSSVFWRRQCTRTADVVVLHPAVTATFCKRFQATAEVKSSISIQHWGRQWALS